MFKPQLVTLQRGALRLEPLSDADIPALVALAEANREELLYMSGTQRLDWYRSALADMREQRALPFVIRLGNEWVGTTRFADFMNPLPACEIGWNLARPQSAWQRVEHQHQVLDAQARFRKLGHGSRATENCRQQPAFATRHREAWCRS